ncbi:hypothetical protein [Clostridium sp.]|uniref:hypothetical protein n=1 Tax=Clostridium sp. TaxID=1506 RepID=UPI003216F01F
MNSLSPKINRRINRHLRKLFSSAFENTKDVKELKEELKNYIVTEVITLIENGESEDRAFEIVRNEVGNNSDFKEELSSIFSNTRYLFLLKLTYVCNLIFIILEIVIRLSYKGIINIDWYNVRIMSKFSYMIFFISSIIFFIWTFINLILIPRTIKFKIQAIIITILNFVICLVILRSQAYGSMSYLSYEIFWGIFTMDLALYFLIYTRKVFKF